MSNGTERYKTPPKRAYRVMGLGVASDGYIKVVAGFRIRWWVPDWQDPLEPLFVQARILRLHESAAGGEKG